LSYQSKANSQERYNVSWTTGNSTGLQEIWTRTQLVLFYALLCADSRASREISTARQAFPQNRKVPKVKFVDFPTFRGMFPGNYDWYAGFRTDRLNRRLDIIEVSNARWWFSVIHADRTRQTMKVLILNIMHYLFSFLRDFQN
jgi:hypothetical protein